MNKYLIESACRSLVLTAAGHADSNEPALLAALFTEDAILVRPNGQTLTGRVAIHQAYAQGRDGRITRHLVTNTLVEVESSELASAKSYVLLWSGSVDDEAGPHCRQAQPRQLLGEFDDRFVLTPVGWRITRRNAYFIFDTDR